MSETILRILAKGKKKAHTKYTNFN